MRKRYVLLIAVLLLAFVAGLAWQLSQPREPMYEGHPLSYWLEGYNPGNQTETSWHSADKAMRETGTNAIPTLLRMLQAHDSPLKVKFFKLFAKQHVVKFHHVRSVERNWEAKRGFALLGTSARAAVPALIEIYECNISSTSQHETALSLGQIGRAATNAVPIFLRAMLNTNDWTRITAVEALAGIHSKPELVVPSLIKALGDNNKIVGRTAAETLGSFGADAKPAVPALIAALNDSDAILRSRALSALKKIDPQAAANLPTNFQPVDLQARP